MLTYWADWATQWTASGMPLSFALAIMSWPEFSRRKTFGLCGAATEGACHDGQIPMFSFTTGSFIYSAILRSGHLEEAALIISPSLLLKSKSLTPLDNDWTLETGSRGLTRDIKQEEPEDSRTGYLWRMRPFLEWSGPKYLQKQG